MMFLLPQDRLRAVHVIRERIEEAAAFVGDIPGDGAATAYNAFQEALEQLPEVTRTVQRTYEKKP